MQNRFNLIDRASDAVLKVCEAHGPAFLPWFPPAGGALTGATATALDAVAESHGATRGQIALAWLLHRSPCCARPRAPVRPPIRRRTWGRGRSS